MNDIKIKKSLNDRYVSEFFKDLKGNPDILEKNIYEMYFSKVNLDQLNNRDVCEGFFDLTHNNSKYVEQIKDLIFYFKNKYKKRGYNIINGTKYYSRIKWHKDQIQSKFTNLFHLLYKQVSYYSFYILMRVIGYKIKGYENGINIFYNEYNPKKNTPLLFISCRPGSFVKNFSILNKLSDKFNLIIPDIPGISWKYNSNIPPTLSDISDTINDFVLNCYNNSVTLDISDKNDDIQINIMGHGLGCNIGCSLINRHQEIIKNFFAIEGQIFIPEAVNLGNTFNYKNIGYNDLDTQYFVNKNFNIDDSFLLGLTNFDKPVKKYIREKKKREIYLFYTSQRNTVFSPEDQILYANKKKIHCNYFIYQNEKNKSGFDYNKEFQEYIINMLLDIYEEMDNRI